MLRITVFKLLATPRPIMLGPRMFRIPSLPRYSTSNASGINESPTADSSDADISEGSATACNTIKDEVRDSEKYRELHHSYLTVLADMENLRVRTKREVETASNHSITRFAKDLLPVLDVLEIALKNAEVPQSVSDNEFAKTLSDLREGVDMTRNELMSVFKRHGIEPIETEVGDPFDPNHHTAIFQVPKTEDAPTSSIIAVQKKGYRIKDRILRHTQVGVSS